MDALNVVGEFREPGGHLGAVQLRQNAVVLAVLSRRAEQGLPDGVGRVPGPCFTPATHPITTYNTFRNYHRCDRRNNHRKTRKISSPFSS